jgi:hypothetical protein
MSWALDRFRHHASTGGLRNGVTRASARAVGLLAERLQKTSERMADPSRASGRLPPEVEACFAQNRALKDRFAGQTALVVASGPSACVLDHGLASGRSIIAVNEMFGPVRAAGLKLAALVIHDSLYFNGKPDMDRMLADAAAAAREDGALLIVPAIHVPKLVARGLAEPGRTLSFFESGRAIPTLPRPAGVIDLGGACPDLQTVSHAALVAALYLGFREINLLGIDLTYVGVPDRPITHSYGQNPYYSTINTASAATAYNIGHGWDWPYVLRDVARQLEAYRWLAEGAELNGRHVVNLAADSLLSAVPHILQRPATPTPVPHLPLLTRPGTQP